MELDIQTVLDLQKKLVDCLSASGSMQDLLEIANEVFRRPMFIKGDGSTIYAITRNYGPNVHPSWSSFINNMDSSSAEFESVRTVSEDPEFSQAFEQRYSSVLKSPYYGGNVLHANVRWNDKRVCEIVVLENGKEFTNNDTQMMDIFTQYVELYISMNKERYLGGSNLVPTITALLENKSVAPTELLIINNQTGWGVDDEYAVVFADTSAKTDSPLLAVFRDKLKATLNESITFIHNNNVVSIVNITRSDSYTSVCRQISKVISNESLHCGMSFEYTGLERSMEFYNLAQLACSIADKLDRKFIDMYSAAHIRITERIHSISDLQDLIHPDLLRLDRLDPQRTSNYLKTLYAYLICGGNYTDTANYLGLHRNSLIYRMNRIQNIIKSDLNDVHNKHFLLISYLIMGISF